MRDDGRIVPWLTASGPLSYTPEDPPPSGYYLQYSWILPGIFAPATNKSRHFYFGSHIKQDVKELFSFWRAAREGGASPVTCHLGRAAPDARITAPVAIYSVRDARERAGYLFMPQGSYQLVPVDDQPLLHSGEVILYRGIQRSSIFRFLQTGKARPDAEWRRVWRCYVRT